MQNVPSLVTKCTVLYRLSLCYCTEVSWLPLHSFRGALGAFEAYYVT